MGGGASGEVSIAGKEATKTGGRVAGKDVEGAAGPGIGAAAGAGGGEATWADRGTTLVCEDTGEGDTEGLTARR